MKLLVTGASGFIGRNVLLRAPRDWTVVAVYHQSTDLDAFIARHQLSHVSAVRCDLANANEVGDLTRRTGAVDACLYLAANGDPAKSVDRPGWDLRSNTLAFVTLLESISVSRVVFVSSGAVYDGLKGPVSPASSVSPTLPYAIAKLASEQYLHAFAARRRSVGSFVNVRFFGAYGPYEPARKITTRWMRAVMAGQRQFSIRGNGQNLIDFMYVDDAVDGFLKLCAVRHVGGTVDFASGAPVTIDQVVETMARVLGVEVEIVHDGHTEEYIEFRSVDPTLRDRCGIAAVIPFDDGIRRLHRFLLQEANGARQPA